VWIRSPRSLFFTPYNVKLSEDRIKAEAATIFTWGVRTRMHITRRRDWGVHPKDDHRLSHAGEANLILAVLLARRCRTPGQSSLVSFENGVHPSANLWLCRKKGPKFSCTAFCMPCRLVYLLIEQQFIVVRPQVFYRMARRILSSASEVAASLFFIDSTLRIECRTVV